MSIINYKKEIKTKDTPTYKILICKNYIEMVGPSLKENIIINNISSYIWPTFDEFTVNILNEILDKYK